MEFVSRGNKKKSKLWSWIWKDQDKDGKEQEEEKVDSFSANQKSKDETTKEISKAESNISKAKQVITEIEAIIQKELSMMLDDTSTINKENSPNVKKKKRSGPKLIRQLGSKKNRMVVGQMVFDPIQNVWLGNDSDLSVFQRPQPGLITNKSLNTSSTQPQKVGNMVFDPVNLKWIGNDKDLAKFKTTNRPALISQLNPVNEKIEKNGMVFDPDEMIWKGNDDEVDIFEHIQPEEEKHGFKVGQEFSLSAETKEAFLVCQKKHTQQIGGWFGKDDNSQIKNARNHLNAIRTMSIIRVINQAKNGNPPSLSSSQVNSNTSPVLSNNVITSPRTLASSKQNLPNIATSASKQLELKLKTPVQSETEDDEDWGDVEFKPNLKLKSFAPTTSSNSNKKSGVGSGAASDREYVDDVDLIEDLSDGEDNNDDSKKDAISNPISKPLNISKFKDEEGDDDDDDMKGFDPSPTGTDNTSTPITGKGKGTITGLNTIAPTGVITNLGKSKGMNTITPSNMPSVVNTTKDIAKLSLSSDDDRLDEEEDTNEWEGLDVPVSANLALSLANPNKLAVSKSSNSLEDEHFWESDSDTNSLENTKSPSTLTDNDEFSEEDWPDVEIPMDGKLVLKSQRAASGSAPTLGSSSSANNASSSGKLTLMGVVNQSRGNSGFQSKRNSLRGSEDELSGLELPQGGLFLRNPKHNSTSQSEGEDSEKEVRKTKKNSNDAGDDMDSDSDWNDVDVPDDFVSKLNSKVNSPSITKPQQQTQKNFISGQDYILKPNLYST